MIELMCTLAAIFSGLSFAILAYMLAGIIKYERELRRNKKEWEEFAKKDDPPAGPPPAEGVPGVRTTRVF